MKKIENKETTLKLTETTNVTYADLLLTCINRPIKEGVDLKTMRRDLRIVGIIETAIAKTREESSEDEVVMLEFEDDDFTHVVKAVEESIWIVEHADILDFADYIDSLKK